MMRRVFDALFFDALLFAAVLGCAALFSPGAMGQRQPASAVPAREGTPAVQNPAVQSMQQIEDRWDSAIQGRDQYGLELVLAPQFVGISASGEVTTRNEQIVRLFQKGAEPASMEQKVVSVRAVGDVAIVNGTYVMHWKTDKGPVDEKGIFSHVFEDRDGRWICLNSQRTVVADDVEEAAKEKAKPKNSNAALPFHIPMVYKGAASNQPAPAPGANQPPG